MGTKKGKENFPRYMMATTAIHMLGDISSNESDLCVVTSEDADNFYGNWVTGFGFVNVRFPKKTTRPLTVKEKEKYNGTMLEMGSTSYIIQTKKNPIPRKAITVFTQNTEYRFGAADNEDIRTMKRIGESFGFNKCKIIFLAEGKGMQFEDAEGKNILVTTSEVKSIK